MLIQHATCIRHIVLPVVASLTPPHFSTLSHKRHELRKDVIVHKMYLHFLYNFFLEHCLFYEELTRYCHKCENVFMQRTLYFSQSSVTLGFSTQIFGENSDIKFNQNTFIGILDIPREQTDRHDEANSRFSLFCERSKLTPPTNC